VVTVKVLRAKEALTVLSPSIVSAAGLSVPARSPLHPLKRELSAGWAESVTSVPSRYDAASGITATCPPPFPEAEDEREYH
jgi:hypothetical protein